MKRVALSSIVTLAASMLFAPIANAAGFIMVDPVAGAPATIAMLPPAPVRTGGLIRVVPPRPNPPVRPPVTRPPSPSRPILHGSVTYGLHLKSEAIKVDINDQVAKTYITQTFVNNTDQNLAGTYLFPLPDDTTFSSFSLHIDGKPIEGKILEANEARQQYEEIVRRMVDPGLLEYADYKTVRARIFPIPAHGTKKVELEYTQVLRAENGMIKYRFPLKSEQQSEPVEEIKVDVKLGSKQGLRTIWSPSHTVSSSRSDDQHAKIALLSHNTVPDKDFLLYYSVSDKELAANLLTHKDDSEYGHFLLTLSPPVQAKQVIGKDIVIVADTSGSMSGEKMEQNRKALKYVVNALNAEDRFNVVQFNTDVEKFRSGLIPATAENKKAALSFIADLEARGGTNIGEALRSGVSLLGGASTRPAYLVFMTDGEPTVGETDVSKLLKLANNARDIRLFDFGVGYDVNTRLLNKLAEDHHGTSQYVEPEEDIEAAVSGFYQKIKSPMLSDVNITYDGVQVKDVYPRAVKDIFAGSQVLLMGRYKGSGKTTVTLTGKINGQPKTFTFPLSFAADETGHTYLPRLWAMRRIGYLTEIAQENGNNREVVDEIIALSKKYGIISAYTSFLVTDPSENGRLNTPTPRPMAAQGLMRNRRGSFSAGPAAPPPPMSASPSLASLPGTRLDSFVRSAERDFAGGRPGRMESAKRAAVQVYGDEGTAGFGGGGAAFFNQPRSLQIVDHSPVIADYRGAQAVKLSKSVREYQQNTVAKDDKSATIKSIEDKTFYLINGVWTDSVFDAARSSKPEVVTFGSQQYFDLLRKAPGISKYLAVGKQVVLSFKGHVYKIVTATGA